MSKEKQHEHLLQAFSEVRKAFDEAVLLMIGDGPLRSSLQAQVDDLQLTDHVRFLGHRTDVPELLGIVDINVLCSYTEGMSIALLESMAAGCCPVVTDVGGNPEIVRMGIDGIVVKNGDVDGLRDALVRLIKEPDVRLEFSRSARARVSEVYDLRAVVDAYNRLYREAITRA